MTTALATPSPTLTSSDTLPSLTVEDLAAMTSAEARITYENGRLPSPFAALDGAPRGRMLAVVGLDRGAAARALRGLAGASWFPWAGKSFHATDEDAGTGINRIRLLGTREWYPFATRVEPSAIDRAPCLMLDYDLPGNPWFIRAIRDELREVSPGLFLGPAMWTTRRDPRLLLWFAIDTRI